MFLCVKTLSGKVGLFPKLKEFMKGHIFPDNEDVIGDFAQTGAG